MTNKAEAILIDSREPKWVQELTFDGLPTSVMMLEAGDVQVVCSDGAIILIERKTPEDLLNSLHEGRLLPQIAHLVQGRIDDQAVGLTMNTWPYLLINGDMKRNAQGMVITDDRGPTSWNWDAVQGALLTIQEMGCMVVQCGEREFEKTVIRIATRERGDMYLLPPRVPNVLGAGAAFLASLPGIGVERVMALMEWGGNCPAHILSGLTDLEIDAPVPRATRIRIRGMLGLKDGEVLTAPMFNQMNQEIMTVAVK